MSLSARVTVVGVVINPQLEGEIQQLFPSFRSVSLPYSLFFRMTCGNINSRTSVHWQGERRPRRDHFRSYFAITTTVTTSLSLFIAHSYTPSKYDSMYVNPTSSSLPLSWLFLVSRSLQPRRYCPRHLHIDLTLSSTLAAVAAPARLTRMSKSKYEAGMPSSSRRRLAVFRVTHEAGYGSTKFDVYVGPCIHTVGVDVVPRGVFSPPYVDPRFNS